MFVVPPLDDRAGLPERAGEPGAGLGAVPAPGDHLGDHGVELRRDDVAGRHPGVDPDAGAGGRARCSIRPGAGAKSRSGSSAVSRASMACPCAGGAAGAELRQRAARRDVQLQLDDVDAGGDLGDRVLHLQPGVDLQE